MKAKDIPIAIEAVGSLDTDGLIKMLAHLITKGDAAGYLRSIETRMGKEGERVGNAHP